MAAPDRCDVLIIGSGPVGSCMAALLARFAPAGTSIAVCDAESMDPDILSPRAVGLDDESLRVIIQRLGLLERLFATTGRGMLMHHMSDWRNGMTPKLMLQTPSFLPVVQPGIPGAWCKAEIPSIPSPSGFDFGQRSFWQPLLTTDFRDLANGLGVMFLPQHKLVGLTLAGLGSNPPSSFTVAKLQVPNKNDPVTIHAKFVLGCDGARSFVRRSVLPGMIKVDDFLENWMVVDFLADADKVCGSVFPTINQRVKTSDGRQFIFVTGTRSVPQWPSNTVHLRVDFSLFPNERIKDGAETFSFVEAVLQPFGICMKLGDPFRLFRACQYLLDAQVAECMSTPDASVFLVGDAAHTMPMFIGQGLNQGFKDVANLCWKLCAVLRGTATKNLLRTYSQDRLPIVRDIVACSVARGRMNFWNKDIEKQGSAAIPGYDALMTRTAAAMRPVLVRLRAKRPEDALAGTWFPQFSKGSDDSVFGFEHLRALVPVFVDLTPNRAVLNGLEDDVHLALKSVDCRLVHLGNPRPDDLHGWLGKIAALCDCLVVLPDAYIFGSAKAGSTVRELILKDLMEEFSAQVVAL